MPRAAIYLSVALLAAACAADTAGSTTTSETVEEPSTTSSTTTVAEATTATEVEGPVDICPRGMVWAPGTTYEAECFVVPVSFVVAEEGFASEGADGGWLTVRWSDPRDPDFLVRVGMVSFRSSESPEVVVEAVTGRKGIVVMSVPEPTKVAGRESVVVDVEGLARTGPLPGAGPTPGGECEDEGVIRFVAGGGGNPIIEGAPGRPAIGVSYCDVARVWAVQVGEQTITIIGGTADPARHEEAVAKIEELFEGMSFDVGGGS